MSRMLLGAAVALILLFNLLPLLVVVPASLGRAPFLSFPPTGGLGLDWYVRALATPEWRETAAFSALLAACVAAVSVSVCFAAALVLTRQRMRGAAAIEAFLLSPLLLPHAATALVLFWLIDRLGARGTVAGIAVAHVILCLPFAYRPIAIALRHADRAEEDAAAILGASPWRVFVEIVLPAARPALLTAFMFTLLLSFDEVTVTVFLVSIDRVTLPVAILQAAQDDASPLLAAVATLLIGFTVVALALVQRLAGLRAWSAALR